MSSKENAAVSQLLALLEARYAIRVLWALRDGHPQTFRLLQDSVGGITVPVRLSGPYTDLKYKIEFGSLISEGAKQKIESKKEELKSKVQEQLQDRLKGLLR